MINSVFIVAIFLCCIPLMAQEVEINKDQQHAQTPTQPYSEGDSRNLPIHQMGRDHNIGARLALSSSDFDGYLLKSESMVGYGRNFGYFEPRIVATSIIESNNNTDTVSTSFGALLKLNLIENKPGNNHIPFIIVGTQVFAGSSKSVDLSSSLRSNPMQIGVGLLTYPFGGLFAFEIGLGYTTGTVAMRSSEGSSQKIEASILNFGFGYILSFDRFPGW